MTPATVELYAPQLQDAIQSLEVALPAASDEMEQDQEWIVVNTEDGWRRIRLHDYGDVYDVQGLYEKWVYDLFQCRSPQRVAELLLPATREVGLSPGELTVLDLGAGNGYVAEVLNGHGVDRFVGIDIFEQAAAAAERDRPGLYNDYVVGDLTDLSDDHEAVLDQYGFNCLTCVAALGFGDIPPEVFAAAYNRIEDDGLIAFTIKTNFMSDHDQSGFSRLIRRMLSSGMMEVDVREPFVHRVSTDGDELIYEAFIGQKKRDIPSGWLAGV